jgi:hypothetical protein
LENLSLSQYQDEVAAWVKVCFGEEVALNQAERRHRFLEEALELFQSAGGNTQEVAELANYVFSRPVGDYVQESGGVSVTHAALCNALGFDVDEAAWLELVRCRINTKRIQAKQANKPAIGALPGSVDDEAGETPEAPPALAEAEDDGAHAQAG